MIFVATKKCRTTNFTLLFCCCFWIRYPGWTKVRIRDKHPGSATLVSRIKYSPFPFSEPTVGPGAAQRAVPPVPDGGPGRRSLAQLPGTLAPRPARASTQCCPRAQHGERVFIDSYAKYLTYWQCCGSESVCFWTSRTRIR